MQIVVLVVLTIIILRWPYLGIAITLASLPLIEILSSIRWASSVVSILGAVTLASFLFSQLQTKHVVRRRFRMAAVFVIGFIFLLWMFLSNPSAAITPALLDGRVWLVTFIQLWIFSWLTASLFDNLEKIYVLMWFFVVAAFISAVVASFQGVIGSSISTSLRADGLAGGANSAARYFIIALVFALFLYNKQKNKTLKLFMISGMAVLIFGILLTVSRTGLLMLVGSIGLFITQNFQSRKRSLSIIIILLALLVVWFFAENIVNISKGILPSILEGSDTVGIRYGLWKAGLQMWLDHPIIGVGIGQFSEILPRYGWPFLPSQYLHLGAHNMYVAVLSETGAVGLFLFLTMFILTLQALLKAIRFEEANISELARNWFIVTILVLLAGITKHDQYDKLPWIIIGMGGAFTYLDRLSTTESELTEGNQISRYRAKKAFKATFGR